MAADIYLDFNSMGNSNKYWNTFNDSYSLGSTHLLDEFGNPTDMYFYFAGSSYSPGCCGSDYGGAYNTTVNWIENAANQYSYFDSVTLWFTNLTPSAVYSLEIASANDSAGGRNSYITCFRANGALPIELSEATPNHRCYFDGYLKGILLTWTNLVADSNGVIEVTSITPPDPHNITYGMINAARFYQNSTSEYSSGPEPHISNIELSYVEYQPLLKALYLNLSTVCDSNVNFSLQFSSSLSETSAWYTTGPKLTTGPSGTVFKIYLKNEIDYYEPIGQLPRIPDSPFFRLICK